MREILFRGKRIDNGEWVEGYYFERKDTHVNIIESIIIVDAYEQITGGQRYLRSNLGYESFRVDPKTVGEYTELSDKNGKRIFEGDVFRMDEDDIAVVVFKDGCFRLEIHGLCGTFTESGFDECGGGYGVIECDPIDWYYVRDMEVIGNIHDNPMLLEVSGDE